MGITINYEGRLRNPADITGLVEEMIDIAQTLGWRYEAVTANLVGIGVDPHPDCDTLLLLFDGEGKLRNPILESDGFFCKTQFAPVSVHVAIVKLLRHFQKRWFETLTVDDEGGFWETGDLKELERRRDLIDRAIHGIERKLRGAKKRHPEESDDDPAARIERILKEHDDRPIRLTDDERRLVLGPETPDPEDTAGWSVDDWVENFQRQDEGKWPLIREMRNRKETEKDLREAVRLAEQEEKRHEEASLKFLASIQHPMNQKEMDDEESGGFEFDAPEPEESPWKGSLPEYEEKDDEVRRDDADERYKLGLSFALQFGKRLSGRRRSHPVLPYVMTLMHSSLIGIRMGKWWARQAGSDHALTARRRLGAERFRTIARLLRSFPKLKLEDMAKGAEKVAGVFAKETQEGL